MGLGSGTRPQQNGFRQPLEFTIQGNTLISVSCGGRSDIVLSPWPAVSAGQFSFARDRRRNQWRHPVASRLGRMDRYRAVLERALARPETLNSSRLDPSRVAADPIRVVIIEDLREVREGLTMLITRPDGFECAASYRTMEDALSGIDGDRPDVILTDIGLPGMDGIEGTRLLRERFPDVPILALSVYDDDDDVFNAICAGASGYC